jgi:lipopolysaccharide exporter
MPCLDPTRSSSFATDVLKLVTGTTLAQVITVLAAPVISRLYGPEAFGFLTLFTSITSIIGVIACMRYELAIMLPKTDEEAANRLGLSLLCVTVITGLTVPALYFGGDALLSLLKAPGLAPYFILVPVFVFISGVFLALNYWNSRTRHFGRLAVARVTNSLAITGTQLEVENA